jgi:hypothetical protein
MTTATTKKLTAAQLAAKFVAECRQDGWKISLRGDDRIVTITKHFEANNREQFVKLDGDYYHLLCLVPCSGGSMWGTDGSGIGGYSAMLHGVFTMNVSGVKTQFAAALAKILG